MIEFFKECVLPVNLMATIPLLFAVGYWLMMIVGVVGFDSLDFDMDVDAPDLDIGGLDMDAGLDVDAGFDVDHGLHGTGGAGTAGGTTIGGGSSTTGNESFLKSVFDFFYLGDVPVVFVITAFVFFFWIFNFQTNHHFNESKSIWVMMLWLAPNVLVSMLLTRFSMIPFAYTFRKPKPEDLSRQYMIGTIGRVTTSEVNSKFGVVEIKPDNEPEILINVRTRPGEQLAKNDAAKIVSYNHVDGTFLVELTKWESKSDE